MPSSGYAKDVFEVEAYVRGFARRRPDVEVTTIRAANVIGPHVVSPITSYFRLPVIPRVLGYDPRLQFLHEDDATDVLVTAVMGSFTGTVNVAGDGVLMLSQCLRRSGRVPVPPVLDLGLPPRRVPVGRRRRGRTDRPRRLPGRHAEDRALPDARS